MPIYRDEGFYSSSSLRGSIFFSLLGTVHAVVTEWWRWERNSLPIRPLIHHAFLHKQNIIICTQHNNARTIASPINRILQLIHVSGTAERIMENLLGFFNLKSNWNLGGEWVKENLLLSIANERTKKDSFGITHCVCFSQIRKSAWLTRSVGAEQVFIYCPEPPRSEIGSLFVALFGESRSDVVSTAA